MLSSGFKIKSDMKTKAQYRGHLLSKDAKRIKTAVYEEYKKNNPGYTLPLKEAYKNNPQLAQAYLERLKSDEHHLRLSSKEYLESEEFNEKYHKYTRQQGLEESRRQKSLNSFEKEWNSWAAGHLEQAVNTIINAQIKRARGSIVKYLKYSTLYTDSSDRRGRQRELSARTLDEFLNEITARIRNLSILGNPEKYLSGEYVIDALLNYKAIRHMAGACRYVDMRNWLESHVDTKPERLVENISAFFTRKRILELVEENARYRGTGALSEALKQRNERLTKEILTEIPEDITELFPPARQKERHFILHIGPTNSGKTYTALKELNNAKNGVYLAPLRLMAYEAFETLNRSGCVCRMETGEEMIDMPGFSVTSSTIELLNLTDDIDIAVIDEAQMISDNERGGAWTNAILGVNADTVHVCMALNAEKIVIKLIEMCSDTYEIRRYKRKTTLEADTEEFHFPASVQSGDALIVFGRLKAIACASDLQRRGYKCSVVYGALPYDARHEEVRKFAQKETDVLVATDAIGMGMNIPIRRIVFLETVKYDGTSTRPLNGTEVKQIAGRAGRFGLYDTGYYTAEFNAKSIRYLYNRKEEDTAKAGLGFPRRLINVQGSVSEIIEKWSEIIPDEMFEKSNTDTMLLLSRWAENFTDDKQLVYELITIPVDVKNNGVMSLFYTLAKRVIEGRKIADVEITVRSAGLEALEQEYKEYDLLYNFTRKFTDRSNLGEIIKKKQAISGEIIEILKKQKLKGRVCRICGKRIEWNSPYSICTSCHRRGVRH